MSKLGPRRLARGPVFFITHLMKTFAEIFCIEHRCDWRTFERRVFWHSLHRRAFPIASLVQCFFPRHFAPDWDLIRTAARCDSLPQIDEEIRDFVLNSANRNWWRRVAKVRLSAQRLRRLARHSFAAANKPSVRSSIITLR
jgi:hypothetical protein